MNTTRIEELIEEFDWYDGIYKREEMEEALTLREEITPHLLRILEEVADAPLRYAQEEHNANIYAVALLAHFQEPAAFKPIIHAFCIPDEPRDILWGDMVTETLPTLLLQTCSGRLDVIKGLIRDQKTPEYVRGAAIVALTYAVVRGEAVREEVIAFLSGLFTGTEAAPDSDFWSDVACAITDLHPRESMAVIRQAFADGLVHPDYVGLHEIEEELDRDQEEVLATLRAMMNRKVPREIHGYLSWFASFQEDARLPPPSAHTVRQKGKNSRRAKGKLAKKARKKNRR